MRLATFELNGQPRAAVAGSDDTLVPVDQLISGGPSDMLALIEAGPALWDRLRQAAANARGGTALAQAHLLAPIPRPRRNVLCVGWNYQEHFEEGKGFRGGAAQEPQEIPPYPTFFTKNPSTVVGPDAPVWYPAPHSTQLDWEAELAVIIGQRRRDVPESDALSVVFGYTAANDVSVRDFQRRHGGQWWKGKNFDSHLPLGPVIVTADELGDPQTLDIRLTVNGVVKQNSNTKWMVYQVPRLIHELSLGMTLEPGDIISTGTPNGVGFARKPPEFLSVGDVVEVEIEKIGKLRNRVETYQEPSR